MAIDRAHFTYRFGGKPVFGRAGFNSSLSSGGFPPLVQNQTPTPSSQILSTQPVGLDVISPAGRNFARVRVDVQYPLLGMYEVIYDGQQFASNYQGTVAVIAGGLRFAGMIRKGGWPSVQILVIPDAVDSAGQRNI
jgi:hypothetical protein